MTDKQIIIDGVDVSKCEYHSLNKNNCSLCSLSNNLICSYKPFCYYKQLKRKEQECKILESHLIFEIQKTECLEQECEELKIYIESNEQQVKEVETLVMDNDRLINELDQLKSENKHLNDLLNQALKEIEAIQNAYEERE